MAFMPRLAVFISFLCEAPYVGRMAFGTRTPDCQQPTSVRPWPRLRNRGRMSYWRSLLFVTMERLELREDLYLRIPNAKTIRRDEGDPVAEENATLSDPVGTIQQFLLRK
jgi:hypothetical protein